MNISFLLAWFLVPFVAGTSLAEPATLHLEASMIVIGVRDLSRSIRFYRETLGLAAAPAPGDLPMFRSGNVTIVLNASLSGSSGSFELVFPVGSVHAMRQQLADRGCSFVGDSKEVAKDLWAATFSDPDGHKLTLFGGR